MKTILNRLKSKAGESLVESMAAILIFTFGSIVLYTMVMAAADINGTARTLEQDYYTQTAALERAEEGSTETTITVQITSAPSKTTSFVIPVSVYGNAAQDELYAYYYRSPEQPPAETEEGSQS